MCFTICAFHFLAILYNNTNHPPIAVIDDFLQRILQLHLAVLSELGDLRLNPVIDDLGD